MLDINSSILIWILHYKYLLLFLSVIIEGPVVTMFAGFSAATGYMNFWLAYLVILAGEVGGDVLYYALGYYGREKIILKYGWIANIFLPEVEKIEKLFKKHGSKTLFITKITHVIGLPFLIAAGIARYSLARFIFADFLATLPKSLVFMIIGYYFSQATIRVSQDLQTATIIAISSMVLFLAVYIAVGRYYYRKTIRENNHS